MRLPTPTRARALLGVTPSATADDVRAAFRRAVRRDRPDLDGLSGQATAELVGARDLLVAMAEDRVTVSGAPYGRPGTGARRRVVQPADEVAWILWRPRTL